MVSFHSQDPSSEMETPERVLIFSGAPQHWELLGIQMSGAYTFLMIQDEVSLHQSVAENPDAVLVLDVDSPGSHQTHLNTLVQSVRPRGALMVSPHIDLDVFTAAVFALGRAPAGTGLPADEQASVRMGMLTRGLNYLNNGIQAISHRMASFVFEGNEEVSINPSPVAERTTGVTPKDVLHPNPMSRTPERTKAGSHAHLSRAILEGAMLGPFRVTLAGQQCERWPSKKGKNLLAFLLYYHDRPCFRDVMIEKFWPDVGFESAKNSLHVALHGIRKQLCRRVPDEKLIICENERYFFNPDIELRLDHEAFLHAYQSGRRKEKESGLHEAVASYEHAATLYKGDLMEDDLHEEWLCSERAMLLEQYLFVLDRLSHSYAIAGQFSSAISLCQTLLAKDECREEVHRRLMRCYYHSGMRPEAIKQFQRCAEALMRALDVAPSMATIDLLDRIKRESLGSDSMA